MMNTKTRGKRITQTATLTITLILAATAFTGCTLKTRVNAVVAATPDVQADKAGTAYPIVVRLYELKSKDAFVSADYKKLWFEEQTVLGNNLIAREEIQMTPGQSTLHRRDLAEETLYLGVAASYREITESEWIKAIELRPMRSNRYSIYIGRRGISVDMR